MQLDYTFPLFVLGWIDLGLIFFAMSIFVFPFTCGSRWYPNEPAPRIVQYGFPASKRLPFVMFVNNTVIHPDWYVSSISEYGGARGTTSGKALTLATTCTGVFQFALALCLYQYGAYESLPRFVLLSLGAGACMMIGLAESALSWKYGRDQQIRLLWSVMGNENRREQLENALLVLRQMESAILSQSSKQSQNHLELPADTVLHGYWKTLLQHQGYNHFSVHILRDGAKFPSAHVSSPDASSFVVTSAAVARDAAETNSSSNLKGCLSATQIDSYISELEHILTAPPHTTVSHHSIEAKADVQEAPPTSSSRNLSDVHLGPIETVLMMPEQPPQAYIALTLFETDVADVIVSGASGTSPELILQTDDKEKSVFANVHMFSAIGLIFCNFAAHVISLHELSVNPARYGSFTCAVVGVSSFIVFCLMQFLSGNYNDSLPLPACFKPHATSWLRALYCPQTQPSSYGKCSKKALALCFICVESLAFLSIVMSTPIEAILLNYYQ